MKFEDLVKKSKFILVDGERKVGKLAFSFLTAEEGEILVISTYPKKLLTKRLDTLENLEDPAVTSALRHTNWLTLKEEWQRYKAKYGLEFFSKDLEKAVEQFNARTVILHRFDTLFNAIDIESTTLFMEKLIELKEKRDFKLFFTMNLSDQGEGSLGIVEDYSDTNIRIFEKENRRYIQVNTSIFPSDARLLTYEATEKGIRIEPIAALPESASAAGETAQPVTVKKSESSKRHIVMISDNDNLVRMHRYLLERKDFTFETAKSMNEMIEHFLKQPDLIIYNLPGKNPDFELCRTLKERQIDSKLIYILENDYVRGEDKMKTLESGCYEIFSRNFNYTDYIHEIEKSLEVNFYTPVSNQIVSHRVITNRSYFCEIVDALHTDRIFFTVVRFEDTVTPDTIKSKLRHQDIVYFDEEKQFFVVALINVRAIHMEPILSKIGTLPKIVKEGESYDWPLLRDTICE